MEINTSWLASPARFSNTLELRLNAVDKFVSDSQGTANIIKKISHSQSQNQW